MANITWNWQQSDWPCFSYKKQELEDCERLFLLEAGTAGGVLRHMVQEKQEKLIIDIIGEEAVKTAEIEGETLNRASVQSSLCRHFGLKASHRRTSQAEEGISDMMIDLYRNYHQPLTEPILFQWHEMLCAGRKDIEVGSYRTSSEPMQIISGPLHKPKIYFEAPPASQMRSEMKRFIDWFNETEKKLPILIRASIAHLYFESIHPFEDGNGRIGRALVEKILAQELKKPSLVALSRVIQKKRNHYYTMLEQSNQHNEITPWIMYFSETIIEAQRHTVESIGWVVQKSKFMQHHAKKMNIRQQKAVLRLFEEGPEGFKGGLSAEKYMSITGASRATATRDLQELTGNKILKKTGALKGTRYWLHHEIISG